MKTFNSFFANANVKSIIAIAAVALTSVFGFTSCDKNDDVFTRETVVVKPFPGPTVDTPKAKTVEECEYKFFASDSILALGDFKITIEYKGEKQEFYASKGTRDVKAFLERCEDGVDEKFDPRGKTITVQGVKEGSIVTPEFIPNDAAIAARPADGKINIFACGFINGGVYSCPMSGKVVNMKYNMIGVPNNQIVNYINSRLATASTEINLHK